jgi:hypothetical protein
VRQTKFEHLHQPRHTASLGDVEGVGVRAQDLRRRVREVGCSISCGRFGVRVSGCKGQGLTNTRKTMQFRG